MRTFFRTLAATAVLTALVLGSAVSTVLAASPTGNSATVQRYDFDEAWCFDYGTSYDCSVVDAFLAVTITPDGRETGRIHFRMDRPELRSERRPDRQLPDRLVRQDRLRRRRPGQDLQRQPHPRGRRLRHCVSTYVLKIVDYELQFEKYAGPGCH